MRPFLLSALVVALSGCFQMSSVLSVRADGSATLREEVTLSGMGLMAMAEEAGDPWADLDLEARAAGLSDGARLDSLVTREDGFTAVYSIPHVGALRYTMPEGLGSAEFGDDVGGDVPYRFRFEPAAAGAPARLDVFVPKPPPEKPEAPAASAGEALDAQGNAGTAQAVALLQSFVGDARLTIAVDVEGALTDTTAPFVEGSRVVLFDLPFGPFIDALAEDPGWLEERPSVSGSFYDQLSAIEGVRVARPGTYTVRFE